MPIVAVVALVFLLLIPFCNAEDWTVNGKDYHNVKVTKVEADTVHIMFDGGIGTVNLSDLTPELQKKFNYDPKAAALASQQKAALKASGQLHQTDQQNVTAIPPQPILDYMPPAPATKATDASGELKIYKAKVYRAVGARWHDKVNHLLSVIPKGTVKIQYAIHADGTCDTQVVDGISSETQLLVALSLQAIEKSAPFDAFSDSLRRQVGDSYTDSFTFSINDKTASFK
jgi:hypothetical protein